MILLCLLAPLMPRPAYAAPVSDLIILCYHDIPKEVDLDNFGVDRETFVNTIEYFLMHGFQFVSLQDVLDAQAGIKELPEKPVMLTFDDAYATFYDFVFPLLKEYKIPSVLAVVSEWLDHKPKSVKQKLMTWDQLKEIAHNPLVEIASHSHNLHHGKVYNPQGNDFSAALARIYNKKSKSYESDEDYSRRILSDMLKSKSKLNEELGVNIRAVAWPYGRYSSITIDAAKKAGIEINFALNDAKVSSQGKDVLERFLVHKNPTTNDLMGFLGIKVSAPLQQRIVQVDLDSVYDSDPGQTERNLGNLLERIKRLKPTTVYLQAFADPEGTGNIKEVYFPNRVLPMRMDLFNRVAHQLRTRSEVEVYAWLPMLTYVLPDEQKTETLRVREYEHAQTRLSSQWYERLSPFSSETQEIVASIYEDLAKYAHFDGIVFQDDGYLNEYEDFHPSAKIEYLKITGGEFLDPRKLSKKQMAFWTEHKIKRITEFSQMLKDVVRRYRPEAKFARTLYAPVVLKPESQAWFAQNYEDAIRNYDYTVIMAYPYLENVKGDLHRWFRKMLEIVKRHPQGTAKTVIKIQTVNWRTRKSIDTRVLDSWLRTIVANGARHVAYYPDDYIADHPQLEVIRQMMSKEDFPYRRGK